jgi:hypothetical protein
MGQFAQFPLNSYFYGFSPSEAFIHHVYQFLSSQDT